MHPLQPLPPMQRLGWLPQTTELKCRRGAPAAFTYGQRYSVTTEKVKVHLKERRARRDGISEPVTYIGLELLVRIKDNHGNWHRCLANPAAQHALIHDLSFLVEHFDIPPVPDLARLHPKQYNKNQRKLKELEKHANVQIKSRR
jgi:hypothetical protein